MKVKKEWLKGNAGYVVIATVISIFAVLKFGGVVIRWFFERWLQAL